MRILIFTCRRDAEKAALATRTVPPEWPVAWIVAPEDADLAAPAGVSVLVRPFDRGRNLNGTEAVLGVAGVLAEQASLCGRVAKIDSDCLVLEWERLLAGDLAGMAHCAQPLSAYGLAYSLSSKAALAALEGLQRAVRLGASLTGEDVCITAAAQSAGGIDCRFRVGLFWESKHNGGLPPPGTVAIHCGGTAYAPRQGNKVAQEMVRLGDSLGAWRRG